MTEPIPPAAPPPVAPYPVYPLPAGAFGPVSSGRREPDRGLDGLLIAAWVLSMLGLSIVVVVLGLVAFAAAAPDVGSDPPDLFLAAALGIGGALLIIAGLSAAGVRSIILRRNLGADRYRGPSPLALLAIWIVASNVIAIPFLGDVLETLQGGGDGTDSTPAFIALVVTPLTLLVITVGFVLVPRALPGVRLLDRGIGSAVWNFVLGVLIGGPAWLVGTMIAYAVSTLLTGAGISPDTVIPMELLDAVHPVLLVFALVVAAPVAEELFFRVVLFSAWEREYGMWRALIGSSLLFAAIHLSLFAFAPILLLAFVLGYVYARTRSYLTVIGIHATFNAISTVLLLTQTG